MMNQPLSRGFCSPHATKRITRSRNATPRRTVVRQNTHTDCACYSLAAAVNALATASSAWAISTTRLFWFIAILRIACHACSSLQP